MGKTVRGSMRTRGQWGLCGRPGEVGPWLGRQGYGGGRDTEAWGYVLDDWQDVPLKQMRGVEDRGVEGNPNF